VHKHHRKERLKRARSRKHRQTHDIFIKLFNNKPENSIAGLQYSSHGRGFEGGAPVTIRQHVRCPAYVNISKRVKSGHHRIRHFATNVSFMDITMLPLNSTKARHQAVGCRG
jgi:hypothetical protein